MPVIVDPNAVQKMRAALPISRSNTYRTFKGQDTGLVQAIQGANGSDAPWPCWLMSTCSSLYGLDVGVNNEQ